MVKSFSFLCLKERARMEIVNVIDPDQIGEFLKSESAKGSVLAVIKGNEDTVRKVIGAGKSVSREMELDKRVALLENMVGRLQPYFEAVEKLRRIFHDHFGGAGVSRSGYFSKHADYSFFSGDLDRLQVVESCSSYPQDPPAELFEVFRDILIHHWKECENATCPLDELFEERNLNSE